VPFGHCDAMRLAVGRSTRAQHASASMRSTALAHVPTSMRSFVVEIRHFVGNHSAGPESSSVDEDRG
jgi:hypothetical protein